MSFLTNLFGKTKVEAPQIQYTPPGFNAGGLSASFNGNNYNVTPNGDRTAAVGGLAGTYGELGDTLGQLRNTVAPGFNDLLSARLNQFNNSATTAIGNLKQNLQSRRVMGSSFGQDTLTRANSEFGQQRDAIVADNFLKSLQANTQLLTQQYDSYSKQFQTGLNELNLEASTAADLTGKGASILADNARAQANLNQSANQFNAKMSNDQASGFGNFLGRVAFAPVTGGGSLFGNAASSMFA